MMMKKTSKGLEYKIQRIEEMGFTVERLGKNIRATKRNEIYHGKVTPVFKIIFGY